MKKDNTTLEVLEEEGASRINLLDLYKECVSKWYWFVISVGVCLAIGLYYVMKTPPSYQRTALIQIRDDQHGAPLNNDFANTFADFGMFSSSADIFNELVAIKSPRLLEKVVDNLDLNVNYTTKSGLKKVPLYGSNLPYIVEFVQGGETPQSMKIEVTTGRDTGVLSDFTSYTIAGEKVEYDDHVTFHTAAIDTLMTPVGGIIIKPNPKYHAAGDDEVTFNIAVSYVSPQSSVETLSSSITAELADEHATVIKLSLTDRSAQRATDILNDLIDVYNQSWVEDRNQMARATSHFINQRLVSLEDELSDVDSDISSFKSQNLLPDVDEASTLYLQQATKTSDEILELNNKLAMARYVHDYLSNPYNATSLMPANSGTGSNSIDNQINEYNKLMIDRNALEASSSKNHPRVQQYDVALSEMRSAVLAAIDNEIVSLTTSIDNLKKSQANATARIAANPTQAKYLLSIGRQQKVKESLYLYLLQKREENELGQTFAPYNTRVLQDARGPRAAVAPHKMIILAIAFIMGLLIPLAIIYIYEMLNTKVRSRRDIESLTMPFMGEIPMVGDTKRFKRHKDVQLGILVRQGKNDAPNEAFRMLRSNLEFMTRGDSVASKVIMVTSAIPASGKTFISMNLAAALAVKHHKVLLIDLDLRRHALTSELDKAGHQGVSAYLSGAIDVENLVIKNVDGVDNLDLISSGAVPPNPAELVGSQRMETLIAYAREHYDYVILDCPPTEAVEDSRTISRLADITFFVVRVGNLERDFVPEIEVMYNENRYPRMGVILNGTPSSGAYAYHYGYSYGYGNDKKK